MIFNKNKFKQFLLASIFISCSNVLSAQSIPAYTITAYDTSSVGYYFMVPILGVSPNPLHLILDDVGRPVYYKTFSGTNTGDLRLQPNGMMTYNKGSKFYVMDSAFALVDSVECLNGIVTDGHEFQILPNGHFVLLGYEFVTMNLSSYSYFGPTHSNPGNSNASVKCGVIQEQDANHNVVFEWHCKDYFSFSDVDPRFLMSPVNVDWTHCNAVELDADGNFLLSSRHFNEITKINRSDSSVVWRLGGNANQFTFTNDPTKFIGQHDIRRIVNGNITLNDNGRANSPFHASAAKEYQLDENLLTANLVWSYTENATSYSSALGSVQRLSNGNTVVDNGWTPTETMMFNVVDSLGNKIFEITFQDTSRSYRAYNFPTLPWTFDRPIISCYTVGTQLFLDAGSGHASYLWSNGATTQTIQVSAPGTYSVFVPIGQGGFISSEYLDIVNASTYCTPSNVNEFSENDFKLFPNPASSFVTIQLNSATTTIVSIRIFDCLGKIISESNRDVTGNEIEFSVANLESGIYFLQVDGVIRKFVKL